jgi:hypothetical protein
MSDVKGGWAVGLGVVLGLVLGGAEKPEAGEGRFNPSFATSTFLNLHQGDPITAAPVFTIQCNAGVWNNTNHIRIIIPSALNLTWNNGVSSITPGGSNPGRLTGGVTGYANGNKTAIVTVASPGFSPGESATISGLQFASPGAPSTGILGAAADGSNNVGYSDLNGNPITIVGNPTLTSGSAQTVSPPGPVTANVMTVTDAATPGIGTTNGLRIIIPGSLNMEWDQTVQSGSQGLSITGGNVGPDGSGNLVTYPGPRIALINVTSPFPSSHQIVITGMKFANVGADSGPGNLYLDTNGSLFDHGDDAWTKTVLGLPSIMSASGPLYTVGDPSTQTPVISVAASPGTPSKITAASKIKLVIPAGLHMSWDQTIKTAPPLVFGGSATTDLMADGSGFWVTYPDAKTALLNVTSDFASGGTLTVSGLKFTSFTAASSRQSLIMDTTVVQVADTQTYGIGAPAITDASSAPGQIFSVNANPLVTQPCLDITVSDDPSGNNRITAAKGIRIRIPGTPSLTWNTAITTASFPAGTATGHMAAGPNVTYEDSNRTAVVAVASDFSGAGQTVTISGLQFQNFTSPMTPASLQLGVNGALPGGTNCATDNRIIAIGGAPSIASMAAQAFTVNDPLTSAQLIKITDAAGYPSITTTHGITIKIPAGFPMAWDTTIKTPGQFVFGGSVPGNVGPDGSGNVVTYPDAQTALIHVITNFGAGDTLQVSGLKFQTFSAPHDLDFLQLFVDPMGSAVQDSQTIGIGQPTIVLSAPQLFGSGDPSTVLNTVTLTEDAHIPRMQAANKIRIHLPVLLLMNWDTTIQSRNNGLVFGGTGSGHLSASASAVIVSYPDAQTALVDVQTDFATGETLTIDGLKVLPVTASGPLGLTLEVNNLGTSCSTTPQTLTIGDRPKLQTIFTGDANGNGSIDRLVLTFDKNIKGNTSSVTTGLGFSITNPAYTIASGSASGAVVTFVLVERGIPDTGVTPTLTYNPAVGNLQDTTGLGTGFTGPQVVQDGAPPVVTGISVADTDGNGFLNTVTITWSEPLLTLQENISDWKLIDANGTTNLLLGLTNSSMVISGNTVTFTLANNSGTTGVPRFLYTPTTAPTIKDLAGSANAALAQTNNIPPKATVGPDLALPPSKITLDASASTDPNGQPLTFAWTQTSGSPIWTLDNPNIAKPSFLGTTAGVYAFQVTVSDALSSSTATVHITIINVPPGADAGSNQTQLPGNLVYLVGLGSSDGNGDPLTFTWTQLSGASVGTPSTVLAGNSVVSFIAPTPAPAGSPMAPNNILVFKMAVSDGTNVSTSNVLVRLNAGPTTVAPTADAGPDQVVYVGSTVQLDGSLSLDPGGAPTYQWSSTVPISNPTSVAPTFVPSVPGIYTVQLVVTDTTTGLASFPSTVRILAHSPTNQAPVAAAVRLQPAGEIVVGDLVVFDGSGSLDPEGRPVTYAWTQVAGPRVVLVNPENSQTSFIPVIVGSYRFQLVVSDGVNLSLPSTVSVTVKQLPSDATFTVTPSDGTGIVNGQALLSASPLTFNVTTSDTSGNFWFFYWNQTSGPSLNFNPLYFGSPNTFTFPQTVPVASPLYVGYYTFQVRATTHNAIVAEANISVVVNNPGTYSVPVAVAAGPSTVTAGQTVTLDASGSSATAPSVFGAGLRPFWSQTGGPPVVLSNPFGVAPTFTPIAAGTYTFQLQVADATAQSVPVTVTVTVTPAAAAPLASGGGGGGGCGFTGTELLLVVPLLWLAGRRRRGSHPRT